MIIVRGLRPSVVFTALSSVAYYSSTEPAMRSIMCQLTAKVSLMAISSRFRRCFLDVGNKLFLAGGEALTLEA